MTDFTQDVADGLVLSEAKIKDASKVFDSGFTLADVLAKRGVKVLAEEITLADATVTNDSSNQYSTSRYASPEGALDALVTKINAIDTGVTLVSIDVVSGGWGSQFIGQLIMEKD